MFTMTYKELRSEAALQALQKLTACRELNYKVAYNVMRMSKVLDQELRKSQEDWVKFADKYIKQEKTPTGIRYAFKEGQPDWLDSVNPEDAQNALKEYEDKQVVIERHKIKMDDIANAKLSPAELYALDKMLEEPKD